MAEKSLGELLEAISVDEIDSLYRSKDINAAQKNKLLREKAKHELGKLSAEGGPGAVFLKELVKNAQEGWDNIVEAVQRPEGKGPDDTGTVPNAVYREMYYSGQAIIGILQMFPLSFLNAFGAATRVRVKHDLMSLGASSGLAEVFSIVAETATNTPAVGITARSFARTIQKHAGEGIGAVKAAEVPGLTSKVMSKEEFATLEAIISGLEQDGVKDAAQVVDKMTRAAGKPEVADALQRARTTMQRLEDLSKPQTSRELQRSMERGLDSVLPAELAGAKPRYNLGNKTFEPVFESDIGKALYIVAQSSPSKADAKYMAWLRTVFPGYNDSSIRTMGRNIRAEIKVQAKSDLSSGSQIVVRRDAVERAMGRVPSAEMQVLSFADEAAQQARVVTEEKARELLPPLMKKFGITFPDLKAVKQITHGNQVMTAAEFYGHLKAMESRVPELSELAKAAIAPGAPESAQIAFAKAATELFTGARSGRIQYNKDFMDLLVHWDPTNVAKGDIAAAMKTFATDIAAATPAHIGKFSIRSQDGYMSVGTLASSGMEWFRNMLLPLSFGPTFVGNSVAALENVAERQLGAIFSADRAHGLAITEAYYQTKGMMLAVGDALHAYGMAYQTGGATRITPGLAGWLATKPTETVVGMDAFHKVIIGRGVMYAYAIRDAMHRGYTGQAAGVHVRNLMQNPTVDMMEEASRIATSGTFQNDLGIISKMLTKPAQYGPGSMWFMFMKSPINLAKYSWDRTPGLQLISKQLYDDILAGGERADMAIGRLTLSNLQAMFFYEMAKEGYITGSGPVNPKLRGAWRATHHPYSARTPDGYIPITNYDPKSTNIGMAADLAAIRDQLDDVTAEQAFMALGFAFMRNFADRTQWRVASDLIDVVQGIDRAAEQPRKTLIDTIMSPVTVVAPLAYGRMPGSVGTRIRNIQDPVARDTRSYLDTITNRAHGYSQTLPPLTDGYGDVVFPPQAMGNKWLGFFSPLVPKFAPATRDRVKLEGDRLQVTTPKFEDYIGQGRLEDPGSITERLSDDPIPTPLTPDQRYRWISIYRNIIRGTTDERYQKQNPGIERMLLDNPEYQKQTDAGKRAMFNGFLQAAKSSAAKALQLEDIELGQKVLLNTVRKALPQIPPEQRGAVQERVLNEVDYFASQAPAQRDALTTYGVLAPDQPQAPPGSDNSLIIYTPYKKAPSGSPQ